MDSVCKRHNVKCVDLEGGDSVCPYCIWEFFLKTMPAEELARLANWSQEEYYKTGKFNEECILHKLIDEAEKRGKSLQETVMDLVEEKSFASILPPVFYEYPLFPGFY